MANLQNRPQLEARFARQLGKLSAQHRRELIDHLGNPPDAGNVPQAFWEKVQRESEQEFALMLLLIFAASAQQHGLSRELAQSRGATYAVGRARQLSRSYVDNGRQIVGRHFDGSRPISPRGGVRGVQPGDIPDPVISKIELQRHTLTVFGSKRTEGIVVSETTAATTQGGEEAVGETVGFDEDDTWFTAISMGVDRPSSPCPICRPLHKKKRSDWARFFPNGPPAHPRCVCWVHYALEKRGAVVLAGV